MVRKLLLSILLILVPGICQAAFLQVHTSTQTSGNNQNPTNTVTATTINNLVVVHVKISANTITLNSVSDDKSNVYVVSSPVDGGTTDRVWQAYGVQTTGGATTITLHFSTSATYRVGADEYSGGATSNSTVFDASQTGSDSSGTSTSLSVSTLTPQSAGELIVASGGLTTAETWTAGTNYTLYNGTGSITVRSQYKLSGTTSETAPATIGAGSNWAEIATAFKPPSTSHTNTISGGATKTTLSGGSTGTFIN